MRGRGGWGAGSQPMSTAVHMEPNKLWRSNSIFNLWPEYTEGVTEMQIEQYTYCTIYVVHKHMHSTYEEPVSICEPRLSLVLSGSTHVFDNLFLKRTEEEISKLLEVTGVIFRQSSRNMFRPAVE